jgi:hypothetical protein
MLSLVAAGRYGKRVRLLRTARFALAGAQPPDKDSRRFRRIDRFRHRRAGLAYPDRLRPDMDSGDHLHPSEAGYRAMAEAIPLALFRTGGRR